MRYLTPIIIAIKLLCAASAFGQTVRIHSQQQICVDGRTCRVERAFGTGCVIGQLRDGRVAILTAAHNLDGFNGVWRVGGKDGEVAAQVILNGKSDGLDVALLACRMPDCGCYSLLTQPPRADAELLVVGFPGGRSATVVKSWFRVARSRVDHCAVEQGMSGGPIYTSGHGLVGVLTGYTDAETVYTPSWIIRPWLQQRLGYVPECPAPTPPGPLVPKPDPISTPPDNRDYESLLARLDAVERALSGLKAEAGPRGERGPAGERGPQGVMGPTGPAGRSADAGLIVKLETDVSRLEKEIAALRATKFPVRTLRPDGSVLDQDIVTLGDPIEFRLIPKAK